MRLFLRISVAALAVIVIVYFGLGWVMVSKAVVAERVALAATPAGVGLAFENVSFPPRDGDLKLMGWHIPAEGQTLGSLVLVHGVDSNRARDGDTYMLLVRDLHDAGFNLLLFDLRSHGESEGTFFSAGVFEASDVLGALDYVTQVKGESWERVGVLSFSLGAASSLLAAREEPRLQALVSDSSYADVYDLVAKEVADRTPLTPAMAMALQPGMELLTQMRYNFRLAQARPIEALQALDYPMLFIHSRKDARFPISYTERLKDAARNSETELWLTDEGEHSRSYIVYREEYRQRVTEYFTKRFTAGQVSALFEAWRAAT